MNGRARWGAIAIGVIAAAGIGLAVAAGRGFGFSAPDPTPEPQVETAPVTRQDLVDTATASGNIVNEATQTIRGAGGTITGLPAVGKVLERGGQLARVDEIPIVLLYGSLPAYRDLSEGAVGADVRQFEKNLAALGYTGFTVDDAFTWATAAAVRRWQDDLGTACTGTVPRGLVHYAPGRVVVTAETVGVGDAAEGELLTIASPDRVVTVDLDPGDADYASVGAEVTVTMPDGTSVPATVSAAENAVVPGADGGDDTAVLRVTVAPDDPDALGAGGASGARVTFTAERREDVLTVPVSALLALAEGGYGVEVERDGADALIAVETGLFADGRVEVSGDGIAENDAVVVAR